MRLHYNYLLEVATHIQVTVVKRKYTCACHKNIDMMVIDFSLKWLFLACMDQISYSKTFATRSLIIMFPVLSARHLCSNGLILSHLVLLYAISKWDVQLNYERMEFYALQRKLHTLSQQSLSLKCSCQTIHSSPVRARSWRDICIGYSSSSSSSLLLTHKSLSIKTHESHTR